MCLKIQKFHSWFTWQEQRKGTVGHICNPNAQEAELEGSQVWDTHRAT